MVQPSPTCPVWCSLSVTVVMGFAMFVGACCLIHCGQRWHSHACSGLCHSVATLLQIGGGGSAVLAKRLLALSTPWRRISCRNAERRAVRCFALLQEEPGRSKIVFDEEAWGGLSAGLSSFFFPCHGVLSHPLRWGRFTFSPLRRLPLRRSLLLRWIGLFWHLANLVERTFYFLQVVNPLLFARVAAAFIW